MILLHNIGPRVNSNYNTREEILAAREPLSFDGVYRSVWSNLDVLRGKTILLFPMGKYVGGDNSFDTGMPREQYCEEWQLRDLVYDFYNQGCTHRLGWHSWSHPNLCTVDDETLAREVAKPNWGWCPPIEDFAYPYGEFDERVIEAVRKAGYKRAWSVNKGDNSPFQLRRHYLNW
jgi:hypothetical protein